MASKKGKTVCMFSAKGGVGKTLTTLNLAGISSTYKKKTLIIDADFYNGGISVSLNKPFTKTIFNLIEDLSQNKYTEFNEYITKYNDYIDFLPCPKDPRQGNKIDVRFIELIIERATFLYDLVLIDTTHTLTDANLVILDKVDNILFLLTNDPFDLKNMKSLISIFKSLEITNYKIILNNSRDPFKEYFSLYDIKNIIKTNIDYTFSNKMFIKNIDYYIMNGKIVTLDLDVAATFGKDYSVFFAIITDIFEGRGNVK